MSRIDRVSEIAQQLEQAILSGRLSPGDQLPSERDISAQMGVSRSVVREALGRLASLGLLQAQHGSGTRVAAPNGREVTVGYQRLLHRADVQMEHVSQVRAPLETTIASLAARHRTREQLTRLHKTQKILGNSRRTLEARIQADLDFHATLAEATGNPVFAIVLEPIQELLRESRRQTIGRYGADVAYKHHAQILAAVEAQDADGAVRAMREHMRVNREQVAE